MNVQANFKGVSVFKGRRSRAFLRRVRVPASSAPVPRARHGCSGMVVSHFWSLLTRDAGTSDLRNLRR
jgi:hypothetical protein